MATPRFKPRLHQTLWPPLLRASSQTQTCKVPRLPPEKGTRAPFPMSASTLLRRAPCAWVLVLPPSSLPATEGHDACLGFSSKHPTLLQDSPSVLRARVFAALPRHCRPMAVALPRAPKLSSRTRLPERPTHRHPGVAFPR